VLDVRNIKDLDLSTVNLSRMLRLECFINEKR